MTRRTLFLAVPAVLAFATAAFAPTASAAPSPVGMAHRNVPICSAPVSGDGACDAIRHDSVPADLQSAYNLPSATSGVGQVVAIVDAYNDPSALSDVNTYRSQFGIAPLSTCTSPSPALSTNQPCFSKVNQS